MFFDDIPYDNDHHALSLSELNGIVREVIELSLNDEYWVEAELASVREAKGHCYMELIEKQEFSNTPVAQARACCWRNTWLSLAPRFVRETGEELHAGMKVLLKVRASFHETFGFSWVVNDIDATFTVGDMVKRRKEILRILEEEGVIDLNKTLPIPMFAKRIAVVSSASAAGYGDFCNQLADNEYGFAFTTRLFPAIMQGEQVEKSVISALNAINKEVENFDVVVIIRGGGSTSDLSGFDTLELAENVANFPLPIITGIGHDRDQSVLDIIACVSQKTPTAVAAFLIDNLCDTLSRIDDASQRIGRAVRSRMDVENIRLARIETYLASAFSIKKLQAESRLTDYSARIANAISRQLMLQNHKLDSIEQRLPLLVTHSVERQTLRLDNLQQRTAAVDPINILRRGYSITLHNGQAVKDPTLLHPNDDLSILTANGVIDAKVVARKQ